MGQCQKSHLTHEFSLGQARKPETYNHCHIGPDHPQWESYQESPDGILNATGRDQWHGAYEILRELAELEKLAEEKLTSGE